MFTKKSIFTLFIFLSMVTLLCAQNKGTIAFALRMDSTVVDPVTGEYPDMTWVHALEDSGYVVDTFYTAALSTASQDLLDRIYNADLVIIGRSVPTTTLGGNSADDKYAWNDIPVPILTGNMWALRSSRLNWFNTTNIVSNSTDSTIILDADIIPPVDPVFNGLGLNTSEPVPWVQGRYDELGTTDPGAGYLLASFTLDGSVAFVRFDPNVEFWNGAGDIPAGYRSFIGNGRDNSSLPPFDYFNFTDESRKVWYAEVANMIRLGGGPKTGVKYWGDINVPSTPVLSQNYPNPFNPTTQIEFSITNRAHTNLSVYNTMGQLVQTLVNKELASGKYSVTFDAANLPSGIYFYQMRSGRVNETRKMILMK